VKDRRKYKFRENYCFIPIQDIDVDSKINGKIPERNCKYEAKKIKLRSLIEAALRHHCNSNEKYQKIMETVLIMLMHTKRIKYKLILSTIMEAIDLCNGKCLLKEEIRFMIQIGENFQVRGWLGIINFLKRIKKISD
jgi:hypothetical protein